MGIRFFCPKGHKLNVKAELAGKIGICPKCGERMLIPLVSTRKSKENRETLREEIAETNLQVDTTEVTPIQADFQMGPEAIAAPFITPETENPVLSTPTLEVPEPTSPEYLEKQEEAGSPAKTVSETATAPVQGDSLLQDPNVLWYIRSLDKQTYGPAAGPVVQSWIREKRIGPTMLIWREGWSAWLEAKNVFPELESIFLGHSDQTPAVPQVRPENSVIPKVEESETVVHSEQKKITRKKKAYRDLMIVIGLITVIVCLITVLVVILLMQKNPQTPKVESAAPVTVSVTPSAPAVPATTNTPSEVSK